jgi:hypothetical protein
MTNFLACGRTIDLPAIHYPRRASKDALAWLNSEWVTIRLTELVGALRVHTDGRRVDLRSASPSSAAGSWILIGDVIHTSSQIVQGRSLPGPFTKASGVEVLPGTILNIGISGPLFGKSGGSWQAEHVSGPEMRFSHLPHVWMNYSGSA